MRYHRIAIWALAFGFVGGAAIAQPRTWTQPVVPNRAWLDRLNLDLGWKVSVPMDGQRDGIATIQSIGGQVIVQTARGRIVCIDGDSGGIRWMATVGEPYSVTHEVGFNDDVVLVANTTRIYALDRADGIVRWDIDLPGTPSSPPAANALAFFVNLSNGRLSSYVLPNAQLYLQGQRPAGPAKGPADVKTPTKTTVPSNDPVSSS